MSTQNAFLLVGSFERYRGGINPDLMLSLHEGTRLAWTARSVTPDLYDTAPTPNGPLVPGAESKHLITDALLRFCPEVSAHAAQLLDLRARLESLAPDKLRPDHWDVAALGASDELAGALLREARTLMETGAIHAKLVLVVLQDANEDPLTDNLLRLNARREICMSVGATTHKSVARPKPAFFAA
jgi:hypothetical protein